MSDVALVVLYHSAKCSKSRESVKALQQKQVNLKIREYLKCDITREEIENILEHLDSEDRARIIRVSDKMFKEMNVNIPTNQEDVINFLVRNIALLERPIALIEYSDGSVKAAIGRPLEKILNLL